MARILGAEATEIAEYYNRVLADGRHNVTICATDVEGNQDSTTKYFAVGRVLYSLCRPFHFFWEGIGRLEQIR